MGDLLRQMSYYKIAFTNTDRQHDARIVLDCLKAGEQSEPFTPELAVALKRLWSDPAISQKLYERRLEFHMHESTKYFLDNLDRISNASYKPTEQDILLTRIKTTGIVEVAFEIKGVQFRVFDVGGQRSERKKWIHCFEDVNSVNRIVESMRLFESICNSRWFINTAIILFLNKKDLFAEKIKVIGIQTAFPEYNGPQNYDASIDYIKKKFEQLNANPRKTIFVHQTCATDTNQVQMILDSVISMIIQSNLHKSGLY
uniref:Uncharacterized protein n=1 Tax=Panagrolaimus sp. ES5 TaxID=591445 RepID=A0AC34FPF4_9BILA